MNFSSVQKPPIRCQALIYPVTDSAINTPSYREKSDGFGLSAQSMQRYWRLKGRVIRS